MAKQTKAQMVKKLVELIANNPADAAKLKAKYSAEPAAVLRARLTLKLAETTEDKAAALDALKAAQKAAGLGPTTAQVRKAYITVAQRGQITR